MKYLLEEAHIAENFLKLDDPSIHVQFFEVHLIDSLFNFLRFNFSHFSPQVKLYFEKKKETKFLMERGIGKILTFVKL